MIGTQPRAALGKKTRSGRLRIRFRGFHRRRDAADDGADGLAASQRGWARRVRDACGGWAGSLGDVEADRRALAGTVA